MTKIVANRIVAGTWYRASREEPDGSIVVGPTSSTPTGALRELDRDAGGPQVRARPKLPGEPRFIPHPKEPRR